MSTKLVPPSTGKKKKARRVFGDAVADDLNNSLSYSPSPQKTSKNQSTNDSASVSKATSLSPLIEGDLSDDDESRQSSGPFDKIIVTEKENSSSATSWNNETSAENATAANESMKERVCSIRLQTRSPLRRDLVKKTQDAINKASASVSSVNQSLVAARQAKEDSHRQKSKQTAKIRREWKEDTTEARTFNEQVEQNRREILSLQRQLSSKFSKEKARVELTQRQAVLQRVEEESQFKSDVFREHQKTLKEEKDNRRRHSVAARSKLRSNHRMGEQKLKMEQVQKEQAIIEERHEASIALRNTIQQNATQRRKSFAFRNGDARRIRQLHATMESERMHQEHKSFELKWLAEKDAEEYHCQLAQARRESLAMRNATGRKQREFESEQHSKAFSAEHESYELKWAAEKDAEAYQRSLDEERRQSLEQRNKEGKHQRDLQQQQHSDNMHKVHESFELKWAGEKDAEQYLRKMEQERRDSLAFRNKEGKRQRDLMQQQHFKLIHQQHESLNLKWAGEKDAEKYTRQMEAERRESLARRNLDARNKRVQTQQEISDALAREHESFELKRAADKDVEAYKRHQEQLRRESLAGRNTERVRHAKVMEELRILAHEKETESYVLKWAGENDVKAYLAKLDEERRRSLQLRAKQTLHHRHVESEQQQQVLNQIHKDEEMRSADQKDVQQYNKGFAERDRKSFEYRRKEARIQRIQEEERLLKLQNLEEQNFELETLARTDVEEYVKDCKQRRRMSLAVRAKENRNHARWQREHKEKEQDERSRLVHDQLMDQRYIELARQKERARIALDALRHAGYSLNPFSGVLS